MSDWDILNLDEEGDWEHFQILDRLHEEGVECYFADIWLDDIVILSGCDPRSRDGAYTIANALNIPERCVYADYQHAFFVINLYELKAIRSGYADKIDREFPF